MKTTDFLVVGAGPYGLSAAAYAQHRGLDRLGAAAYLEGLLQGAADVRPSSA